MDRGAKRYEETLAKHGFRFDVVLLSAGEDGHVGALYPRHHSIEDRRHGFIVMDDSPKPPPGRMTSSLSLMQTASAAVIVFAGEAKREAWARFNDARCPVSGCPAKLVLGIAAWQAKWGLLAPVVILGGIYGGVFTPTEAAVVAVVYGLFVGFVVFRNLRVRDLHEVFRDASVSTAVVMIVVAFAGLFSWTGSTMGIMDRAAKSLVGLSDNPVIILLLLNAMLLVAGMLLDAISIYYVFLPILIPLMKQFSWDPIWFGVMMTVNLAVGTITPPVAVNLYVASNISGASMTELSRWAIPFVLALVAALHLRGRRGGRERGQYRGRALPRRHRSRALNRGVPHLASRRDLF